jgi:hypothetical protein
MASVQYLQLVASVQYLMLSAGFLAAVQNRGKGTNQKASFHTE